MKPANVVDHHHYFAYEDVKEKGGTEGRYDACLTKDDGAGVWSPDSGMWWKSASWEFANAMAAHMATYHAAFILGR